MLDREMEKSIKKNRKETLDAIALLTDKAGKVRGATGECLTLIAVALRGISNSQNGAREYETRKIIREEFRRSEHRLLRWAFGTLGGIFIAVIMAWLKGLLV